MLVADGQGVPIACRTSSASPAEVTLVEDALDEVTVDVAPTPVIVDRAYCSERHRGPVTGRLGSGLHG